MERFRSYEPDQQVFVCLNPAEQFGRRSFEVFLVETIRKLDMGQFWTRPDNGGETPYDPRAMLGIILYGFCRGIFSSRKLEHACRFDTGFMYVSGHNTPDHVAICRFLKRFDQELRLVFRQIVYAAHASGYIDYHQLAVDGTKIRANVSREFTGTIKDFKKRVGAIDSFIGKAVERLKAAEVDEIPRLERSIAQRQAMKSKLEEFLEQANEELRVTGAEHLQNITDPDCRVMLMSDGSRHEAYNAQACVDSQSGLIVGEGVFQAQNDMKLLNPALDTVVHPTGQPLESGQVLADAGYWDAEQIGLAENRGVETYIPDPNHANPFAAEKPKVDAPRLVTVALDDQGRPVGTCSGGKMITACPTVRKMERSDCCVRYRIFSTGLDGHCMACTYREQCFPPGKTTGKKKKAFSMSEGKTLNHGALDRLADRMESSEGKQIYANRMPLIERTFAEVKHVVGFRRFLRRGLRMVQLEWVTMCMAINIRRMYALSLQHQG